MNPFRTILNSIFDSFHRFYFTPTQHVRWTQNQPHPPYFQHHCSQQLFLPPTKVVLTHLGPHYDRAFAIPNQDQDANNHPFEYRRSFHAWWTHLRSPLHTGVGTRDKHSLRVGLDRRPLNDQHSFGHITNFILLVGHVPIKKLYKQRHHSLNIHTAKLIPVFRVLAGEGKSTLFDQPDSRW